MEEVKKKSKGSLIVIILLVIVIIGLVLYILFAGNSNISIIKNNNKNVEDKNTTINNKDNETVKTNVISNEEAISIGEDLYKKAASLYVSVGGKYEQVQPDQNGGSTYVCYRRNNDRSFTKANCSEFIGEGNSNYYFKLITSDITDLLTKNMFNVFILNFSVGIGNGIIEEYNGEYYRLAGDRGGNTSYRTSDLTVVKNDGDVITFDLTSYYDYSQDPAAFDKSKADKKIAQPFVIKKEDGVWKVDRFTEIY